MHGATIGRHSKIRKTIIDKYVTLPEGTTIGYDLDEDIESFAIYLGKSEDDLELVQESLTDSQLSLSLDAGERYFWQIITLDSEGNTSKSEVYSFQTTG